MKYAVGARQTVDRHPRRGLVRAARLCTLRIRPRLSNVFRARHLESGGPSRPTFSRSDSWNRPLHVFLDGNLDPGGQWPDYSSGREDDQRPIPKVTERPWAPSSPMASKSAKT